MTNAIHSRRHARPAFAAPFSSVLALACMIMANPAASGERVEVLLDQARVVTLPANAKTMILGNPAIADITLLKRGGALVITGKSYGETNLIALDNDGKLVVESTIRVSASGGKLMVQRGMERNSYICNPRCEPTISLGDDSGFMNGAAAMANARNSAARPNGNQ